MALGALSLSFAESIRLAEPAKVEGATVDAQVHIGMQCGIISIEQFQFVPPALSRRHWPSASSKSSCIALSWDASLEDERGIA